MTFFLLPLNLSSFLSRLVLNMIPHSAPKTPAGKRQILKKVSFYVVALISPWAHGFVYLRKLFGIADSESVWIKKGDGHLSHGANKLRVVYPL